MIRRARWVGAAALAAAAIGWLAVTVVRRPAPTPERNGWLAAERLGCFDCHGPGGAGGLPNLGASAGEVPGWTGGALAMYANGDAEVREWIAAGMTRRQREADAKSAEPVKDLLTMPSFGVVASPAVIADLAAYVEAVAGWPRRIGDTTELRRVSAREARGRKVAEASGCFGCHGPGGLTGAPNPRSFKGDIPPWTGADFRELVRSDAELAEWIGTGTLARFEANAAARWIMRRQLIRMPAFGKVVAPADLPALTAYIRSL